MDIATLTRFLFWCTIVNGGLLVYWAVWILLAPELVYRTQSRWVPISRETFHVAMYSLLGLFKVAFLFLNLVPWIALLIIA